MKATKQRTPNPILNTLGLSLSGLVLACSYLLSPYTYEWDELLRTVSSERRLAVGALALFALLSGCFVLLSRPSRVVRFIALAMTICACIRLGWLLSL